MGDYYNSLSTLARLYFLSALVGGSFFTISMLLQILGGDGDSDVEFDGDVDAGGADLSFKILSIQGITAFSLMFGLTGLSLVQDFGLTAVLSLPLATAAGVGMVAILRKIFQVFMGFATSGTVRLENALAEQGEVYLTIPAHGEGQVQLIVQGRHRTVAAISADNVELATGIQVVVTDIDDDGTTLVVRRINQPELDG